MHGTTAFLLACLAAGACTEPDAPGLERSAELAAAPAPELGATATLRSAAALASLEAERLQASGADLAARGEALRARAAALSGPVIPPGRRARLEAAASTHLEP
ncbi:MAG TPA: hypothetical protein VK022_07035 [Paracoccaceae bacterium]|nr:hypothetical protein [Paracoccaceae bacterium]